ncbi:glycosyltransferase [Xenorhabdus lircayensis]|uniref:Uncharacterized protein n=1 Tax=Xenorhabdus lircayensis TaxID=2763499 RepID=A0ABS0U4U9_9GAMM|nr:glycosyltransferase [Xenorhabdus lircayensis]MBI6548879.1 hypothetical protein [Xenorhabdus lircayensis]
MNIPRKIHYFWTGNNISENDFKKIITMKDENPGFTINIWGNHGDKSLILNTLKSLTFNFKQQDFDIGTIFGIENLFVYRDVEEAFYILKQRINIFHQTFTQQLNRYKRSPDFIHFKTDEKRYGKSPELIDYLHHIYMIHINKNHIYDLHLHADFHNYAAASDIARLVILYVEGGIYLDADVELTDSHIKYRKSEVFDKFIYDKQGQAWRKNTDKKTARFEKVDFPSSLGFGDISGRGGKQINNQGKNGMLYPIDFKLQRGGKGGESPRA